LNEFFYTFIQCHESFRNRREREEKYLLNSLEIMWCYNTYADFMISLLLVIINDRTCLISIYDILVLYSPIFQFSDHFSMKIYFFMMGILKFESKVELKIQNNWQFKFKWVPINSKKTRNSHCPHHESNLPANNSLKAIENKIREKLYQ
jgi:hypothetical protein